MTIQANVATGDKANDAIIPGTKYEILDTARRQVLEDGIGLTESQLVEVLELPDEALPAALQLAHEVRLRGAARTSRSRASSRSRPAAAPRTATSAASRACSTRPCAACGSTSRSWSRPPRRPPPPAPPSSASSPPSAAPTSS